MHERFKGRCIDCGRERGRSTPESTRWESLGAVGVTPRSAPHELRRGGMRDETNGGGNDFCRKIRRRTGDSGDGTRGDAEVRDARRDHVAIVIAPCKRPAS